MPWVSGDPDYGKIAAYNEDILVSDVVDTETYGTKVIRVTENVFGSGVGVPNFSARGSNSSFDYDDEEIEWETYTKDMRKAWRYIQVKATFIVRENPFEWNYLIMDMDYETEYVFSGNNSLWQYTKIKGGL